MKGDFSRDTFDPSKHFSRVLMQQGRVQLDADWNEQNAILLHYLRTLAKDILGPYAGPKDESEGGFKITKGEVDGTFAISLGRYYVGGILVENERTMLYSEQLGIKSENLLSQVEKIPDGSLFYLDVWERHITYIEHSQIREAALGGPDTCSRSQVAWQVKVLNKEGEVDPTIESLLALRAGKLMARARHDKHQADDLCVISPDSRYRGAENQLYRIEVHSGRAVTAGNIGQPATFKWSRENGSVIFPIREIRDKTVTVEHVGRDQKLSLKPGDWVEFIDESISMSAQAGPLARVEAVDRAELTVTVTLPPGENNSLPSYTEKKIGKLRPYLRRWDHMGDAKFGGALQIEIDSDSRKGWIELEDGVQVKFPGESETGVYRTGDYWLIPARVATGDLEWPSELDEHGNVIPVAVESHGPRHYYAPLARMKQDQTPDDSRTFIKRSPR